MNSIRGVLLALALLIFGVLAVTACGGDDDDDDAGDNVGAQTSAPADNGDSGGDEDTATPADEEGDPTDAPDNGGSDNGGDFDASQVCDLLSKSDVEEAFGVSMLDPEYIPLPDVGTATVGSCSFVAAETADSFSLTVYAADDATAEGLFNGACSNKDSAGVGDESCWFSEAHTEIQMLSGSNFVDLFVTTVDGDPEAIATTLADGIHGQVGG